MDWSIEFTKGKNYVFHYNHLFSGGTTHSSVNLSFYKQSWLEPNQKAVISNLILPTYPVIILESKF